jgi:protein ImuB
MTLSHARALLGEMGTEMGTGESGAGEMGTGERGERGMIAEDRPDRDAACLTALAHWAHRFAPIVEPDPPDGLLMDVTGCGRIYRGQRRLLWLVTESLRGLGFAVRAAAASHVGAAWALARYAERPVTVAADQRLVEMVSALPVAALRVDRSVAAGLSEVAIETVGDVLAMDRGELAQRFGGELLVRLDQATGRRFEPIVPHVPPEVVSVEREFAGPVKQMEAIELTMRSLLEELAAELLRRRVGVSRLDIHVKRYDAPPVDHQVTLSRRTTEAGHLWKLLAPWTERLNMGHGVEAIRLTAGRTQRPGAEDGQRRAWAEPTAGEAGLDEAVGRLVDVTRARLGVDRVTRVAVHETHVPEAVFTMEPMGLAGGDAAGGGVAGIAKQGKNAAKLVRVDRPTWLARRVEVIEVTALAPDGPVVQMRMGGAARRIITSIGPERIAGRWWLGRSEVCEAGVRDYFKVQDEGGVWHWIYREQGSGRWFRHGMWG